MVCSLLTNINIFIREHIPLEQGLRLQRCFQLVFQRLIREHIPLEQGLRQNCFLVNFFISVIREHIPLEQGLRLFNSTISKSNLLSIREHIPLEQGLRRLL